MTCSARYASGMPTIRAIGSTGMLLMVTIAVSGRRPATRSAAATPRPVKKSDR
jgi:hypothetical protein